jgi:integrase/recombinase XerD
MNEKEPKEIGKTTLRRRKHVAGNRAVAQRAKLDAQAEARMQQATERAATDADKPRRGQVKPRLQASRRASTTIARHRGLPAGSCRGDSSPKTLEWHGTALGLMQTYLEKVRGITLVGEIGAPDISAWFANMRTSPGSRGKI